MKSADLTLIDRIERADQPADIFDRVGMIEDDYRRKLILIHPDRFAGKERARAEEAARKLADLYHKASGKTAKSAPIYKGWEVMMPLAKGDVADLYIVQHLDGANGVLKVARSAADNDLIQSEGEILHALWHGEPERFFVYLPQPVVKFKINGRGARVFSGHPGLYSLQSLRDRTPGGIPFRHAIWMLNRALSIIGFLEHNGIVHGGITPRHLLYSPVDHGLKLVGWCSATMGKAVPIVAEEFRWAYAPEILQKRIPGPGTDLYMAMKSVLSVVDAVPKRFAKHIERWTAEHQGARGGAWEAQDEWLRLAEEEFGPPKFVEFKV